MILVLSTMFTATHDPPTACMAIRIPTGMGRRIVGGVAVVGERGGLRWKGVSMLRARSPGDMSSGDGTTPTVVPNTAPHFILIRTTLHAAACVAICVPLVFPLCADMEMAMSPPSHFIRRAHRSSCPGFAEACGAELRRMRRVTPARAPGHMQLHTSQDGPSVTVAALMDAHLHTTICPRANMSLSPAVALLSSSRRPPMRVVPTMDIPTTTSVADDVTGRGVRKVGEVSEGGF